MGKAGARRPADDTGAAARAWAARTVDAVLGDGRSLDDALAAVPASLSAADRGLVSAMAYGVLRERRRLEALLAPRLSRAPQPVLRALLLVGLFQIEAMRIPAHAAVHATVGATRALGLSKARGLVNAILRRHQRDRAGPTEQTLTVRLSYPDWLVRAVQADWGALATDVLVGGNRPAPMQLRVNKRVDSRYRALSRLATAGIACEPVRVCDSALVLASPLPAADLPGFDSGGVSIQDGAAQLAAGLLAPAPGMRVLDACAAPGNKSAHLLEAADIDLLALDIDETRRQTLEQTLTRIGRPARTRCADAADTSAWWDGEPFDRILLDAPCSGTGVIRRHPDIKWLRRADDIPAAARRQAALLTALWPTLARGGQLLYATCSILAAEGVDVVGDFIARQADAVERPIDARWGFAQRHGRRIAPGMHGFDGFYYALLERKRVD